jgi:hypothetical protein
MVIAIFTGVRLGIDVVGRSLIEEIELALLIVLITG